MSEKSPVDEVLEKYDIDSETITITKDGETYELSESRIKKLTSKFIEFVNRGAVEADDFGMNAKVVELLIDVKKAYWPATQKSITASVKDFDKQLDKWYILQRDILEQKKKQKEKEVIVYDMVDTK